MEYLKNYLPPYMGNAATVVDDHNVFDIVSEVTRAQKFFASDYDGIAKKFWKGNAIATYRNLFDFCKREFVYRIESEKLQTTRSPAAIVETAKTVGVDCKHYSLWIAGVLASLKGMGYDVGEVYLRFVSYDIDDKLPGHVFVVAVYRGKEYFIDCVLSAFDKRTPNYFYKLDKKINVMPLQRISGMNKVGYMEPPPDDVEIVSENKSYWWWLVVAGFIYLISKKK